MSESTSTSTYENVKLTGRDNWTTWFEALQLQCQGLGVWDYVDPDGPDLTSDLHPTLLINPKHFDVTVIERNASEQSAYDIRLKEFTNARAAWERARDALPTHDEHGIPRAIAETDQTSRGTWPTVPAAATMNKLTKLGIIDKWIRRTVTSPILKTAITKANAPGVENIQKLIKCMKQELAPWKAMVKDSVRREYRRVLAKAKTGVNAKQWYDDWQAAYLRGKLYKIPEIEEETAILDFLHAVRVRLNPSWGQRTYETIRESMAEGRNVPTLDQIGYRFALTFDDMTTKNTTEPGGAYSTFAGRSDSDQNASNKRVSNCPCDRSHRWKPVECRWVETALTSTTKQGSPLRLDEAQTTIILDAVKSNKWKSLQSDFKKLGWLKGDGTPKKPHTPKAFSNANSATSSDKDNGHIVAVLMKGHDQESNAIFSAPMGSAHPLSMSTVMDSCGAMHLVNDKRLLEAGSYTLSGDDDYVESGTTTLPVTGRGTRIMRGVLDGPNGKGTADLTLTNVAYVEGFHVNIVSETLLRRSALCEHEKGLMMLFFGISGPDILDRMHFVSSYIRRVVCALDRLHKSSAKPVQQLEQNSLSQEDARQNAPHDHGTECTGTSSNSQLL
ncbi:hypothetical protein BDP81DRAFT_400485 [Colletotrichum phormii]|uniref:Retrovirus-related Pol polyprotein from transposon TNT 1-94 n=1 Tax=Colletotrichum phormii TaxID=359342 RepID=A0AAI9ZEY3_9PEZI|nr:uncharacterized protein BDP81DRAFT_400485 [Colletotrichum phormii]KAK1622134.1 hypothetical protein BDP81DRAFT_400485 [Colletotrichum phormii]